MAAPPLTTSNGHTSKRNKRDKTSKATSSTLPSTFTTQLNSIETSLSTSSDLNPLFDLIQLLKSQTANETSGAEHATSQRGIKFLVRSLQALLNDERIPLNQVDEQGLVQGSPREEVERTEADKAVANWLRQRWNESVELLCSLLGNQDAEIRVSTALPFSVI
jgi:U3 small nucleolar RNA-associated protein 19